jgi:tRNA-splicing ligase RtcB
MRIQTTSGEEMTWNGPLNKIDDFRYEIPKSYKDGMRTSGLIFVDQVMVSKTEQDNAPEQVTLIKSI